MYITIVGGVFVNYGLLTKNYRRLSTSLVLIKPAIVIQKVTQTIVVTFHMHFYSYDAIAIAQTI